MRNSSRIFASAIFAIIALFLVSYTWVPARDSLQYEAGKVTNISSRPNTWYEVEITTASGARVTCRTRRGWPPLGPSRCPLEKFEHLSGHAVNVLHDRKTPYEMTDRSGTLIEYSAHKKVQVMSVILAALMLALSFLVWRH